MYNRERVEINFNKKVFEIYIAKYRIVFIDFLKLHKKNDKCKKVKKKYYKNIIINLNKKFKIN